MSITAESADLNNLIQRDEYRRLLNETSEQYERMGQFISNLESDIRSIGDAIRMLEMQQRTGYDIGDSKETLGFQKNTLQSDLNFYLEQSQSLYHQLPLQHPYHLLKILYLHQNKFLNFQFQLHFFS